MTRRLVPHWLRPLSLALPMALAMACNGSDDPDPTDETDTDVVEVDADDDGYNADVDCDDNNPDIHPDAVEDDCEDPVDYNCDGVTPLYADADNDGYAECVDCNDNAFPINPGADEKCNNLIDDDCDELIDGDDDSVVDAKTFYEDGDRDAYGNPEVSVTACSAPAFYVEDNTDCDDTERTVHPDADEVCDTLDNDCDSKVDDEDEDVVDSSEWFADDDKDLLGDAEDSIEACFAPVGYIDNDLDCDDSDPKAGAASEWYRDDDEDGFGLKSSRRVDCTAPAGFVSDDTDCDDGNAEVNPDAIEVCDKIDNDCDGDTDDDDSTVSGTTDWYPDTDEDGYGDEDASATAACVAPTDYVDDDTDCDDTSLVVHPGRFDFDDDIDNDCDSSIDEDVGSETYSHDTDIQSIWNSKCTSCHGSSGGLSLVSAHSKIVGASSSVSGMDQIEPGDLTESYLWHKLEGTHASVGGSGSTMPRSGTMTTAELGKIETWILEGAVK